MAMETIHHYVFTIMDAAGRENSVIRYNNFFNYTRRAEILGSKLKKKTSSAIIAVFISFIVVLPRKMFIICSDI